MSVLVKKFNEIGLADLPAVGGKNASLGEMFNRLASRGILVPDGFATTAAAFSLFLGYNQLSEPLESLMRELDRKDFANLKTIGARARKFILEGKLPQDLQDELVFAYRQLGSMADMPVAIRSSATAEDLPDASFAGQHESFLNIRGSDALLDAVRKCYASLYTDRAIKYREDKGFAHEKVLLSVGIQRMVRSDMGCSGVAFTLEPESGFRNIIHISGVWGLGENLVQGTVTPDEFLVFKPTMIAGKYPIVQKKMGDKLKTMIYSEEKNISLQNIDTPTDKRNVFVLPDNEVIRLAQWCLVIEDHYGKPMDIEWAKDGISGNIFIIQARPETVQSAKKTAVMSEYRLEGKGTVLAEGQAVGMKVASGVARILASPEEAGKLKDGEIVVTNVTSPDWDPVLKRSSAIITNKGGRTSHASIVARELGVPAVVGCNNATGNIKDGELITVSCCEGKTGHAYRGRLPFRIIETDFSAVKKPERTKVMLIAGDPEKAFRLSLYPNDGVGLMRLEFIINHMVQIHPMALVHFATLKDEAAREKIEALTSHYADKKQYFIEKLAEGIATIAAAFYPRPAIVRMSDFKTNEYAHLVGGSDFEPSEENPMIGFRGASRYYHELYREGFQLECAAVNRVRQMMGLENVQLMIPFCRTIGEAKKVLEVLSANGLDRRTQPGLKILMMAEIPSNVLLAEQFAHYFDGFSIGSNDLTQLTLGIDRDSTLVSGLFSEQDEAAQMMIGMMIEKAKNIGVPVGLCGQAPSDYPDFARFLVARGITSISFNPDALQAGIENIVQAESRKEMVLHKESL